MTILELIDSSGDFHYISFWFTEMGDIYHFQESG